MVRAPCTTLLFYVQSERLREDHQFRSDHFASCNWSTFSAGATGTRRTCEIPPSRNIDAHKFPTLIKAPNADLDVKKSGVPGYM